MGIGAWRMGFGQDVSETLQTRQGRGSDIPIMHPVVDVGEILRRCGVHRYTVIITEHGVVFLKYSIPTIYASHYVTDVFKTPYQFFFSV